MTPRERAEIVALNTLGHKPPRKDVADVIEAAIIAAIADAYIDAEDVVQRFLSKQDHKGMSNYEACDRIISEIRLRSVAARNRIGD